MENPSIPKDKRTESPPRKRTSSSNVEEHVRRSPRKGTSLSDGDRCMDTRKVSDTYSRTRSIAAKLPLSSSSDSEYNENSNDDMEKDDYGDAEAKPRAKPRDDETLSTISKFSTKSHSHALDIIKRHTKTVKWRGVKFISSQESMAKFLVKLQRFFVEEDTNNAAKAYTFYTKVEKSVQSALTEKRSAAAQAGAKKFLSKCKELHDHDNEMYTVEEVQSLSKNEHSFYWFVSEFVECVASPKVWGRAKYNHFTTDTDESGIQFITNSDEAYALFIYENYFAKWMMEAKEEKRLEPRDATKKRKDGKYTCSTSGGEKFGGLSHIGNMRYNQLLKIVKEDRQTELRRKMEEEVRRLLLLTPKGQEAKQREEARRKRIYKHELAEHKEKECEHIDAMMEFYD